VDPITRLYSNGRLLAIFVYIRQGGKSMAVACGATTLSIMTLSITIQHNDTQYALMLCVIYAECRYAVCLK